MEWIRFISLLIVEEELFMIVGDSRYIFLNRKELAVDLSTWSFLQDIIQCVANSNGFSRVVHAIVYDSKTES